MCYYLHYRCCGWQKSCKQTPDSAFGSGDHHDFNSYLPPQIGFICVAHPRITRSNHSSCGIDCVRWMVHVLQPCLSSALGRTSLVRHGTNGLAYEFYYRGVVKCNIWERHGADGVHLCTTGGAHSCRAALVAWKHYFQSSTGSWIQFFCWWNSVQRAEI